MSKKKPLKLFKQLPLWAKFSTLLSLSIGLYVLFINTQNTPIETLYFFAFLTLLAGMIASKHVRQKHARLMKKQKEKKEYVKVQEDANLWLKNLKKDLHKEIRNIKKMYVKKGKESQNSLTLDSEVLTLDDTFTLVVHPVDQHQVFLLDTTNAAAQNPIQANRINTVKQKLQERGISSKVVVSKHTPKISAPTIEYIESSTNNGVKLPPHLINLN